MQEVRDMTFHQLQLSLDRVFDTAIQHLGLEEMWEYVCQKNKSASSYNYHSTRHMREMATIAYWLLNRNYYTEAFQNPDAIWAYDQCKAMVAACLIHDMNHSLGRFDDDHNIIQAIDALVVLLQTQPYALTFLSVASVQIAEVERNIRITRFPYSDDMRPNTIYQRCIRDADILYSMQDTAAKAVVDNLRLEMGVRFEKYRTCSRQDFISDRMPFLSTCEMFTREGREVMQDQITSGKHEQHLRAWATLADVADSNK